MSLFRRFAIFNKRNNIFQYAGESNKKFTWNIYLYWHYAYWSFIFSQFLERWIFVLFSNRTETDIFREFYQYRTINSKFFVEYQNDIPFSPIQKKNQKSYAKKWNLLAIRAKKNCVGKCANRYNGPYLRKENGKCVDRRFHVDNPHSNLSNDLFIAKPFERVHVKNRLNLDPLRHRDLSIFVRILFQCLMICFRLFTRGV